MLTIIYFGYCWIIVNFMAIFIVGYLCLYEFLLQLFFLNFLNAFYSFKGPP